jgi:predicted dehydrogenase
MTKEVTIKSHPLALGFIGGALNSAVGYTHYASSKMDNQWSLVAGCFSRNTLTNEQTGKAYGVSHDRVYASWQEMLAAEKEHLDAITILTPTPAHGEIVTSCLEQGVPVICEKALGTDSTEARRILETRNRHNNFLAVTYNYSGYPMLRELRNKIELGELGKIIHFQAEMPQEGFIRLTAEGEKPVPQSWRLVDGEIPTIHLDLAVHLHQLIHYVTGKSALEVISQQNSCGWFPEIIDNVSCLARYTDDVHGQFWFSKSAMGQRNGLRLRIYGTKASAEWYQLNPEELTWSNDDGRREIIDRASAVKIASLQRYNRFKSGHPAGFIEAFANVYCDIATSLHQYKLTGKWDSKEVYSAELALEGFNFLEAMVRSVESRTWQEVDNHID